MSRVDDLLDRLGDGVEPLSDGELRRTARVAAAAAERMRPQPARPWRPFRLRLALAAGAVLLAGSGLGVGFAAWLTPSGSAAQPFRGLGFLPAAGWTVVQSGGIGPADEATVVASTVPLHPSDSAGGLPYSTLARLPRGGVVLFATLATRGNPGVDAAYPPRTLPLRLADAVVSERRPALARGPVVTYALRAGVGGYNVDAQIFFGGGPAREAIAEADRQLQRLIVAPEQVTIAVRPSVSVRHAPVTVYGSLANGQAGEQVTIEFRQCGLYPVRFRGVTEVTTHAGGGWTAEVAADSNGLFRARAGGQVSAEVRVLKRPYLNLARSPSGGFEVSLTSKHSFWKKRVVIQRFDRRLGNWANVKTVAFDETFGAGVFVWSVTERFPLPLPKGTTVRAVLPLDQARPCYIAAYSNVWRV